MKMEDASVLLTGASGGIGSCLSRQLVHAGARVLLAGRSQERLLSLAAALQPTSAGRDRVDALVVDITTESGRNALVQAARARQVNVLVNNAGIPCFGSAAQARSEQLQALIQTNVMAPMLLTAGLLPHLQQQRNALILNVGSVLGELGIPGFTAYGASKAALRHYSQSLRRELQGSSVKVLLAEPRAVRTAFNDEQTQAFNQRTGTHADTPEVVARTLLKMLQTEQSQRVFGFPERLAVILNRLFPLSMDMAFERHRRALDASQASQAVNSLEGQ
jgi:short-subunit dehydrogenase